MSKYLVVTGWAELAEHAKLPLYKAFLEQSPCLGPFIAMVVSIGFYLVRVTSVRHLWQNNKLLRQHLQ